MTLELLLRFLLGGAIVSLFAVIGEAFKPKTFAGLFGAAPSVAIASLALAYAKHGASYASVEGRSMLIGAGAFYVYGAVCVAGARRKSWPVWAIAGAAWGVWLIAAVGALGALMGAGLVR